MLVDLVQATASDGVRLHGALHGADHRSDSEIGVDAALCLHGTGSNFYASNLLGALAPRFVALGLPTLVVNTRGHDGISTPFAPPHLRMQGAAYEIVDHCRHDIGAWLELLVERGYRRVALVGHSLGALKAIYSQAHEPHDAVRRIVAISPPRLSHAAFRAVPQGEGFLRDFLTAQAHVDAGRPQALMEIRFPLAYTISAAGFLDKYGPDERYNIVGLLDRVRRPLLATYGSVELGQSIAFRGMPEAIEGAPAGPSSRQVAVVTGADHYYSANFAELIALIESWLRTTADG